MKWADWLCLSRREARLLALGLGMAFLATVAPEQLERLPNLSPIHWVLGWCPADGTTRALAALFHGQLSQALDYNLNVIVTGPVIVGLFFWDLTFLFRQHLRRWRTAGRPA